MITLLLRSPRIASMNEFEKKRVTVRCFHLPYITLCLRVFCVCVGVCSFYQVFHSREVNKLKLLNNDAEVILVIYNILVLCRLLPCSIPLNLFLILNILFKSFAIFGNSSLKKENGNVSLRICLLCICVNCVCFNRFNTVLFHCNDNNDNTFKSLFEPLSR